MTAPTLTADERFAIWYSYRHLTLPAWAAQPEWVQTVRADSPSYISSPYQVFQNDKKGFTLTLRDPVATYSGPCPEHELNQWRTGPLTTPAIFLCGGRRGHFQRFDWTGREKTIRVTYKAITCWIESLTEEQRDAITLCGTAATKQDLHWVLADLLGPKPRWPFDIPEPAIVGDQYALFEAGAA